MKRIIALALAVFASAAMAHGHATLGADGVVYVYPDAQGRFDAVLPDNPSYMDDPSTDDANRARAFLAHVYLENSSVWQSDNPMFNQNSTVWRGPCNCTVYGAPQYNTLSQELGK